MPLLVQIAGMLTAGALVFALARQSGVADRRARAAMAVVPIVVLGLLIAPNLRNSLDSMRKNRAAGKALSEDEARTIGGTGIGLDIAFLDWARERIDDDETFHVLAGGKHDPGAVIQWATFQLSPRLATDRASADWLIFYDRPAPERPTGALATPISYAPRFQLMRRADAR